MENECEYCLGQGEHWPIDQSIWVCPKCDAEYYESEDDYDDQSND